MERCHLGGEEVRVGDADLELGRSGHWSRMVKDLYAGSRCIPVPYQWSPLVIIISSISLSSKTAPPPLFLLPILYIVTTCVIIIMAWYHFASSCTAGLLLHHMPR